MALDDERNAFEAMRTDLETNYFGKWAVVHQAQLRSVFDLYEEAEHYVRSEIGDGAGLIRKIGQRPLYNFAYIHKFDEQLQSLANMAQPEDWNYRYKKTDHQLPVLFNYLHYTFSHLQDQDKIEYTPDSYYASINTGLVTRNYESIFGLFHQNMGSSDRVWGSPKWFFQTFCTESDRRLTRFNNLPDMARYFTDPSSILYDTRLDLRKNVDHIIDENRDRFPDPYFSMEDNFPLRIALEGAIDHAINRVDRNYKTAIPQFYKGRIQLLLPLCMKARERADLALVVYRKDDVYLASTCLTLDPK